MPSPKHKNEALSARLKQEIRRTEAILVKAGKPPGLAHVVSGYYCVKYRPELFDLRTPGDAVIWTACGGAQTPKMCQRRRRRNAKSSVGIEPHRSRWKPLKMK